MKTSELVGTLRSTIKAHSDDTSYTDSYLYSLLIQARAEVLSQKLRKLQPLSKFNEQTICVPLERVSFHDCSCVSVGCDVMKSSFEIPQPITTRSGMYLKVMTINGEELPMIEAARRPVVIHSETLGDKLSYDLYDRELVIWNSLTIPVVLVRGIFYDPLDLANLPECNTDGTETGNTCYDPTEEEFPIEPDSIPRIMERALQFLGISLRIREDMINNTADENV